MSAWSLYQYARQAGISRYGAYRLAQSWVDGGDVGLALYLEMEGIFSALRLN